MPKKFMIFARKVLFPDFWGVGANAILLPRLLSLWWSRKKVHKFTTVIDNQGLFELLCVYKWVINVRKIPCRNSKP